MRTTLIAGCVLVVACGFAPFVMGADPAPKSPARSESLELVVVSEARLTRIELRIELDGRSASATWNETFDKLFAYYDRNGDGALDEKEAAQLPSPFALRQLLWGQSTPYSGRPAVFKELDTDGDNRVSKAELVGYFQRGGIGHPLVGVGRPQSTAALTAALLKGLDTDNNGTVSEAEWKAAADALRKLDRNDDELIGPGELVPKIGYPGTLGAILLAPPTASEKPVPELDGLPVIVLPADLGDTHWASVVVGRRDRDKDGKLDSKEAGLPVDVFAALDAKRSRKLTPAELAAWRKEEPTARHTIRLGKLETGRPAVERTGASFETGQLRIDVRPDPGKMPELVAVTRKRYLDRFTDADANADGFVEESEIAKRNQSELRQLLPAADRDGDGKLSRAELVAWLDLQDQITAGHALLTVLDHGAGLFELLDVDHDGSLSVPELRGAWDRVKGAGCIASDGRFDAGKLPRQLILTVSRGHPVNPLGSTRRDGPAWFKAMDRNGDGFVSRREFTGTAELFEKLDLDKDGLLSPEEAKRAEIKK
ncbi:transaldolase/EF-hand domain-containing protein [Gemmata sp. SH-PL17]|uniref:EF-hand domain-containing protein n=1 Tax=Gemmata sp. SH-PL17 TaxID=1630693 RepID=UPI00078D8DD9|nr:EF-hand domain-containing protein [Gemmata sp. SH-PL17]AMV25717.1 transaldolase/EF-hand domain-containing protein [Gemmata sp. SH-PL17]